MNESLKEALEILVYLIYACQRVYETMGEITPSGFPLPRLADIKSNLFDQNITL